MLLHSYFAIGQAPLCGGVLASNNILYLFYTLFMLHFLKQVKVDVVQRLDDSDND